MPAWAEAAVDYLDEQGWMARSEVRPNEAMPRVRFKMLMDSAFGGGYKRTKGKVTAAEVGAALVRRLGQADVAAALQGMQSPDGWSPEPGRWFGTEIVARELGLRHDRPTTEDEAEASLTEPMRQADIAWAVWKAKTSPNTWNVDLLENFKLETLDETRRAVVKYALSLVGTPYVYAGEWPAPTPSDYPYGAQKHGGFDCSGFAWYILRRSERSWSPIDRPYKGWDLPERSSAQMAKATEERLSYEYLRPADLIFFAPEGASAKADTVYHAGIYIGRDWMVHSSASRAGISLAYIGPDSWWADQIAWGRRVVVTPDPAEPPS
ncbi:MAG TPA: NlpC/P60 family protein [Actinomycetota bacterium]|nr:NlpC/P60 family protein [Actinomycetota bacterium]